MTKEQFESLWALLQSCRAGDPRASDKKVKRAWWLVLEPYEAEPAKQALLHVCRRKEYFPFVGEVTALLPQRAAAQVGPRYEDEHTAWLLERWLQLRKRRRAEGVPETVGQAQAQGMDRRQVWTLWEERGVGLQTDPHPEQTR